MVLLYGLSAAAKLVFQGAQGRLSPVSNTLPRSLLFRCIYFNETVVWQRKNYLGPDEERISKKVKLQSF